MDFSTIQNHVKNYLLDLPDETEALIPDWINLALREFEETHNFRYMEASQEYITTEAARQLGEKPSGWKESRAFPFIERDDGGRREIDWGASASDMVRQYSDDADLSKGVPQFLLETPEALEVYPFPDGQSDYADGEYVIEVPYWGFSEELSDPSDTNWVTDNYPWYLIYAATAKGMIFNREEERATGYIGLANDQLTRARRYDKRSRLPDRMSLSVRGRVFAPGRLPRRSASRWR